ncbi:MAG: hypothetical protein CBB60_007735 [Armatimonadetes bacterium Cent15-Ar3]|jgi:hypothetical protein|nr:MAG: hypothetical protein CBB60_007735 [Armatimonadetes bacterium Cent15-Ar3]
MRRFDRILGDAVLQPEALRAARALGVLKRWEEVVGPAMADRSWPDRYDHGKVFVAVTGSAWAQELRMQKETLLMRLRDMAGDNTLFIDLRFGVRPLHRHYEQVISEDVPDESLRGLSIREIAERRLKKWHDDSTDHS